MAQTTTGMVITRVDPTGLCAGKLQANLRLLTVNNVSVEKLPVRVVCQLIGQAIGQLVLEVMEEGNNDAHQEESTANVLPLANPPNTSNSATAPWSPSYAPPTLGPLIEVVDAAYMMGESSSASSQQQQQQQESPPPPPPPFSQVDPPPLATQQQQQQQPMRVVQARAYRASPHIKVGIRLRCRTNGTVVVDQIAADGLFYTTALKPGMVLQRVNGTVVQGQPQEQVVRMIAQTVGELHLVALCQSSRHAPRCN